MKTAALLLLTFTLLCAEASSLTQGMTMQEVESDLGKPASRLEFGEREVLIYEDNGRLEFQNGNLYRIDGKTAPEIIAPAASPMQLQDTAPSQHDAPPPQHLLDSELDLSDLAAEKTITETSADRTATIEEFGGNYDYGNLLAEFEASLDGYDSARHNSLGPMPARPLLETGVGFIIEALITLVVLKIAFNLCGFPCLWHQIILLSVLTAIVGAALALVLKAGLFNPVRIGTSFLLLLVLIRQCTDVREWSTAIKIALTARVVSIIVMWLAFAGMLALIG